MVQLFTAGTPIESAVQAGAGITAIRDFALADTTWRVFNRWTRNLLKDKPHVVELHKQNVTCLQRCVQDLHLAAMAKLERDLGRNEKNASRALKERLQSARAAREATYV